MTSSSRPFWPRDQTCTSCLSCIGRWVFSTGATWEALYGVSSYILVAHPFKSVCVYAMRQGSKFIHLPGYPVVSETSFFQLNSIDILVKNRLTLDIWICFWTTSSVFYMPVLMLVFHYFDYCHFVGSFEVVSLTSLSPFFFFFDPVLTLAIPCEFFKFIF